MDSLVSLVNDSVSIFNETDYLERIMQKPPPTITIITVTLSAFMVAFGILGNGAVIVIISRVLATTNVKATVYVYILFLSIIDLIYLLSQPFSISYEVAGTWLFDLLLCRLNIGAEIINKTLSVYVLVILSGDRYTAICKPMSQDRRDMKKAAGILALTTVLVFIGNIPMYIYTEVYAIVMSTNLIIKVCQPVFPAFGNTSMWHRGEVYYAIYLEICYFCVPAVLILTFYGLLLYRLRQNESNQTLKSKLVRRRKVTTSIMIVILFYFGCWAPYWIFQVLTILKYVRHDNFSGVILAKLVYLLPLANSCFNPVLYGILNQRLRKQYAEAVKRERQRRQNRAGIPSKRRSVRRNTILSQILPNRGGILAEITDYGDTDPENNPRFYSLHKRFSRASAFSFRSKGSGKGRHEDGTSACDDSSYTCTYSDASGIKFGGGENHSSQQSCRYTGDSPTSLVTPVLNSFQPGEFSNLLMIPSPNHCRRPSYRSYRYKTDLEPEQSEEKWISQSMGAYSTFADQEESLFNSTTTTGPASTDNTKIDSPSGDEEGRDRCRSWDQEPPGKKSIIKLRRSSTITGQNDSMTRTDSTVCLTLAEDYVNNDGTETFL